MDFGCSKSKFLKVILEIDITFTDIAGIDQTKLKLQEVIIIVGDTVVVVVIVEDLIIIVVVMAKMG